MRFEHNERKARRFPSPSFTSGKYLTLFLFQMSDFRGALSNREGSLQAAQPRAPQRTLWQGQGAAGVKGQPGVWGGPRGRNATEMGSGLTWLWIKSVQTWAGSSWGSSWIQAAEDVFFPRIVWNSDLWIPPWFLALLKIVLDMFLCCYFIDNTEHLVTD